MKYLFRPSAEKQFFKLDSQIQKRIIEKLEFFMNSNIPIAFAEHLTNHEIGSYRFRIGDYRVVFDLEDDILVILKVGHRRDIYK
ncbi:type II toxin-antitoxin system RelE/ParE family toxin [Candidatus Amesbacteria bacterium]|nr:type II toxin-antitoxin system RelE/ParE family toxin [Candidatus Amesbacteria bacterium]MBI2587524.1 type II toxin-antitoxin system RelE/ParE family toxin [Candidatus Amesbacteria bacterium]